MWCSLNASYLPVCQSAGPGSAQQPPVAAPQEVAASQWWGLRARESVHAELGNYCGLHRQTLRLCRGVFSFSLKRLDRKSSEAKPACACVILYRIQGLSVCAEWVKPVPLMPQAFDHQVKKMKASSILLLTEMLFYLLVAWPSLQSEMCKVTK